MDFSEVQDSTWSKLIDEPLQEWPVQLSPVVEQPGRTYMPQAAMNDMPAAATVPIMSSMASAAKSLNSSNSTSSAGGSQTGGNSKWPWALLAFLLLLLLVGGSAAAARNGGIAKVLKFVGIEVIQGPAGQNGLAGQDGLNGLPGAAGAASDAVGTRGPAGQNGAVGANGSTGANGQDGSNACISGLCVSRQTSSPGTAESGNINIDGTVLANQVGVNASPTNTLSVGGTANFAGHTATGNSASVNGYTNYYYDFSGLSGANTVLSAYETPTLLDGATTAYNGLGAGLRLDPASAPSYATAAGATITMEVAEGNSQDFDWPLNALVAGFVHNGTGTVAKAKGVNAFVVNASSGTLSSANGIEAGLINVGGTITNARSLQINTPINFGAVTNNYGLYISDQSSVGSTSSYNMYSAGSTAKNFFEGIVGLGTSATTAKLNFAASTANNAGLAFGTDTLLYRTAAGAMRLEHVSSNNARLYFGTGDHYVGDNGGDLTLNMAGNQFFISGAGGTVLQSFATYDALPAITISSISATQKALVTRGFSGQSANLQEWQNSSSTPLAYVKPNGTIAQSGATSCAVSANASGELICTSDERLKDIQGTYTGGLEELTGISTIRFNYKNEDYTHVGFSAQNVGLVLPEATPVQADGSFGFDSNAVLALSINSIKEINANVVDINSTLTTALDETKGDLAAAKARLDVQGLRIDEIGSTLEAYAIQLQDHETRIQTLENKIKLLEQGTTISQ